MSGQFILKNGEPERCNDLSAWGRFMSDDAARRVGRDEFDGGYVSTVFLGLDHNFSARGAPLLWETMIFGGPHDGWQDRYTSRADALAGHLKAVEMAQAVPVAADAGHGV